MVCQIQAGLVRSGLFDIGVVGVVVSVGLRIGKPRFFNYKGSENHEKNVAIVVSLDCCARLGSRRSARTSPRRNVHTNNATCPEAKG